MVQADRSSNSTSNYEKVAQTSYIKEGTHKAIIYSIVDLWTQLVKSKQHWDKMQRRWRITRELPNIKYVFNKDKGEQVAIVSQEYTQSMYNSQLLKLVQSINNVKLTETQAKEYDITELLGKWCRLQLVHNGEYVNINGIIWLDEWEDLWTPSNELVMYDIDSHNEVVYQELPKFVRERIANSPEYQKLNEVSTDGDEVFDTTPAKKEKAEMPYDDNEDLPF